MCRVGFVAEEPVACTVSGCLWGKTRGQQVPTLRGVVRRCLFLCVAAVQRQSAIFVERAGGVGWALVARAFWVFRQPETAWV